MPDTVSTYCRICEPNCPLIADIDNGRILKLRPNHQHPVSQGFACHKGLTYLDIHNDPDRLDYPLRRLNPRDQAVGQFERVSWDAAFADIGNRLRAIRERHGPSAIAVYAGTPLANNSKGIGPVAMLASKIGSPYLFTAATQDMSNQSAALEAMFGHSHWTIPDFYNTQYLLSFGSNPKVSHWTGLSTPRPLQPLQDIIQRGGKVRFVNPRRIESAGNSTGEVLQIKPDTDVYFLAALLQEIDAQYGFDEAVIARHGKNIDGLRAFVAKYPAAQVQGITGLEADVIRTVAREFSAAKAAAVYMSTGANQTRQGTLACWLLYMLSFVTGNLGRKGGNYNGMALRPSGTPATSVSPTPEAVFSHKTFGEIRLVDGQMPACMLADFIEAPEDPIRALIVDSANPILSVGGEERLRKAFPRLELLICADLYRSATGELADYILPVVDWLERDDMNSSAVLNGQPIPYVQYTDAVVSPKAERKEDWWIVARIEHELGLPNALDDAPDAPYRAIEGLLSLGGLSIDALRALPHQTAILPVVDREALVDDIRMPDRKIDCCPALFTDALHRCATIFDELARQPPDQLKLIGLRTNFMHNTTLANMKTLKRWRNGLNPLHIHPSDAAARNLGEGDAARIFNVNGSICAGITLDETLRPGVVAMSHGYGNNQAPGLRNASALPGVNCNNLVPTGPGSYDTLSNMSNLTGIAVDVEKAS